MKEVFRKLFKFTRAGLSTQRREEAMGKLVVELDIFLKNRNRVLSFASSPREINLWPLNHKLALENRLYLPKVEGTDLKIYKVEDLSSQLYFSSHNILEPVTERCQESPVEEIDCILVPGLGFDRYLMRIGYGKGHYDRLLKKTTCLKIGIGFREQLTEHPLPTENHDQKLDHLILV